MTPSRLSSAACLCLLLVYVRPAPADAAELVITLTSTSGAKMRTLVTGDPEKATANLILLTGGDGRVIISGMGEVKRMGTNFLVRARDLFVSHGFLTALVDAPFDRRKPPGLLGGYRASEQHAADLAKVAAALTAMNGKPVVVIGTSRGTVSAANLAARQTQGTIHAAILASSVVKKNNTGATIQDLPLADIKVPVLFVHNVHDGCKVTLLSDLKPVVETMKRAGVKTELILVESRERASDPCQGSSPHGFLDIEQEVIGRITDWIRARL